MRNFFFEILTLVGKFRDFSISKSCTNGLDYFFCHIRSPQNVGYLTCIRFDLAYCRIIELNKENNSEMPCFSNSNSEKLRGRKAREAEPSNKFCIKYQIVSLESWLQ